MNMSFTELVVVIPTRNRANLAKNAIRSVLSQPLDRVRILVSDNSTLDNEAKKLHAFCNSDTDSRIIYVRPPKPLSMSAHWDWAIGRSLTLPDISHVSFLTDRMIIKRDMLRAAIDIAKRYPDKLLSYNHDRVVDYEIPVRIEQFRWTGKIFQIDTRRLLFLVSKGILHNSLPRMLNSIVPLSILDDIRAHYGNVFESISPDFNFCFRALNGLDHFLYFDRSVLFHYALNRSNGESIARCKETFDHLDFITNLGTTKMNFAAPIPEFKTVFNAICHEYYVLKNETQSEKFPAMERRTYLKANAEEISRIEDRDARDYLKNLLVAHGWHVPLGNNIKHSSLRPETKWLDWAKEKLVWLSKGSHAKCVWLILGKLFSIEPPEDNRFEFRSTEDAIGYATRFPRTRCKGEHLGEPLSSAKVLK